MSRHFNAMSQEDYLSKVQQKHGGKYGYDRVVYTRMTQKIEILCPEHGYFFQQAQAHLLGCGCPKCQDANRNNKNRNTTADFIEASKKKCGDILDYSEVVYLNAITPVILICKMHGRYSQTPAVHLNKKYNGCGCMECWNEKRKTIYNLSTTEFIEKAQAVHGTEKYDYSMVEYKNNRTKVKIKCNQCGEIFEQFPSSHLAGVNCPTCAGGVRSTRKKFLESSNAVHGKQYGYSNVEYVNAHTKVSITCQKHGDFHQTPNSHLNGNGCPHCKNSNGERKVRRFLETNNVLFVHSHRFKDCRHKKPLPFDFYLEQLVCCIEFDGQQHFGIGGWGNKMEKKESFELRQLRDAIKTKYCLDHGIKLIRIRYDESVEEVLTRELLPLINSDLSTSNQQNEIGY